MMRWTNLKNIKNNVDNGDEDENNIGDNNIDNDNNGRGVIIGNNCEIDNCK